MMGHPGKKTSVYGDRTSDRLQRIGMKRSSLDWYLTEEELHSDLQHYVRDLLHIYQKYPALYESDDDWDGFQWINANDGDRSIFSFVRYAKNKRKSLLFVCNFTPMERPEYRSVFPNAEIILCC